MKSRRLFLRASFIADLLQDGLGIRWMRSNFRRYAA